MTSVLQFILQLTINLLTLLKPSGAKAILAENLLLRQQLIIANRGRKRSPNIMTSDRFILAVLTSTIRSNRLKKVAVILKPATLIRLHKTLIKRKYKKLYSSYSKPGPKGPSKELINLVLEIKQRNPRLGYDGITLQIQNAFGTTIDKHVVRRILQKHYQSTNPSGLSWLTFLSQQKDSLWSVDFFRCESISLKSHWVMVVMDVYSRRIIGFSTSKFPPDGIMACRMFNKIVSGKQPPKYLSSDNDPLFKFHRWKANLRVLDVEEIKSIPYVPQSHPFIERIIGTTRREFLDHTLFWNERDLLRKLNQFKTYYNETRGHLSIDGQTPIQKANNQQSPIKSMIRNNWKMHCNGLFQTPVPA